MCGISKAPSPDLKIEKLVFLGGESRHISTCQAIAKSLRIAAQLGDPLARLVKITQVDSAGSGVELNQPQPGWAVPFGLCLVRGQFVSTPETGLAYQLGRARAGQTRADWPMADPLGL